MKLKILEIGAGPKPQAQLIWPDADIETLDINPEFKPTYLYDAETMPEELYEKYDALLASHVLEHFVNWKTAPVLKEWIKVVKINTGQVHVVVPSFEWAAEQALSEHPSKGTLPHLFGGNINEWDTHKTAFTMRHLRVLFDYCGLAVIRARTGPYNINAYGEVVVAEQHYVCGVRKPEVDKPEVKELEPL
jgi:predicted SAM-dependent methyltransferase